MISKESARKIALDTLYSSFLFSLSKDIFALISKRECEMKNSTIWKFHFLSPRLFSIFNDGIIYDLRGPTKWRMDEERAKRREREKMVKDCKK